mmetsp:Transcript_35493/g.48492  ORF Transcript_35493/g.48492 Transcript_35493/m.48492 type:complete len:82 (-) Transcript_35493:159-404(-)
MNLSCELCCDFYISFRGTKSSVLFPSSLHSFQLLSETDELLSLSISADCEARFVSDERQQCCCCLTSKRKKRRRNTTQILI